MKRITNPLSLFFLMTTIICGAPQAETLADRLVRQSPWSGSWFFDGFNTPRSAVLSFRTESGALIGKFNEWETYNNDNYEGPVTDLKVTDSTVTFQPGDFFLEIVDGNLRGTGDPDYEGYMLNVELKPTN